MAKEIERKFLVREEILIPLLQEPSVQRKLIAQYYLVSSKEAAVRIRRTSGMEHAVLTVKSGGNGISTDEFEFDVPLSEYLGKLSDRVGHEIVKTRHLVIHNGRTWEVDVFGGIHEGLVVAELECDDAAEVTDLPDWVGEEVTYDSRFKNAVLALKGRPVIGDVSSEDSPEMIAGREAALAALAELDGPLLDYMSGTDKTAARELRTSTINPFSEEARAGHGSAGLTEGLMFAPGDAVFMSGRPADESSVEGFESISEEGVLIHVASHGHAAATSPHADGLPEAYAGIADELSAMFGQTTEGHRFIDQSNPIVIDESIRLEAAGKTTDELTRKAWQTFVAEVNKEI